MVTSTSAPTTTPIKRRKAPEEYRDARVFIFLETSLHERVREAACAQGVSISLFTRNALINELTRLTAEQGQG